VRELDISFTDFAGNVVVFQGLDHSIALGNEGSFLPSVQVPKGGDHCTGGSPWIVIVGNGAGIADVGDEVLLNVLPVAICNVQLVSKKFHSCFSKPRISAPAKDIRQGKEEYNAVCVKAREAQLVICRERQFQLARSSILDSRVCKF
jgi:hypothetical protein